MTSALDTASLPPALCAPTVPLRALRLVDDSAPALPIVPEQAVGRAARGVAGVIKSVFDVILALVLLTILAPMLLAIAVAIRLDGGPALFLQTRIGRDGREFRMVKFRSMVVDAECLRTTLEAVSDVDGPLFKMRQDPRITRLGILLRRYSIDEMPQLLNVLTGSMSLVGPRPPLPGEVAMYCPLAHRRLTVKPGMTGLWQVSGRSDLSWDESLQLDLTYVDEWSLALEMKIIAGTARAVLGGRGAY